MAHEVLPQDGCKPFSLTCEHLQGNWIKSNHQNNIVVKSTNGNIILDCWIKNRDGWVTGVKFLSESSQERAQSATAQQKKNFKKLHIELDHSSKSITHATAKTMGVQETKTFKLCEDYTLGKAKKIRVNKKAVACSKILGERLFLDIISPPSPTFWGKKHWLLVMKGSNNYAWSFFLKEKFN